MKLRIFTRTLFLKNLIIFVALSYLFVYFVQNFNHPKFFDDLELLTQFTLSNPFFYSFTLFLIIMIFVVVRWSKYLFLIYTLGIFAFSIRLYFVNNIPAILPLSLVYMMCSYYFYSLFQEELNGAIYIPNYEETDINPVFNKQLKVKITKSGKEYNAYLVNWDEGSLFAYLGTLDKLRGRVGISIEIDSTHFSFEGKVVTAYNKGYGIKVIPSREKTHFDWNQFFEVITDRGYNLVAKEF